MPWVRLRSPRDPAFWAPLLVTVVLLGSLVFVAHAWLSDCVRQLHELAASDPSAARAQAVRAIRLASWSLCAVTAGFGAFLFRHFQLGRRQSRLPPSGWWSFGALRVLVGPDARRASQLGQALCLMLLVAALGFVLVALHLIRLLESGTIAA